MSTILDQCSGLTAADWNAGIPAQIPQIKLRVLQHAVKKMPYASLLGGGRFDNNQGSSYVTSIPQPIAHGYSEVAPGFTALLNSCGPAVKTSQFGFVQYSTTLGQVAGQGSLICVNGARFTVAGALKSGEEQLRKSIVRLMEADNRYNMYALSGIKVVVRTGESFASNLTGGEAQVNVTPPNKLPNASPTLGYLSQLSNHVFENFNVDMYAPGTTEQHLKWISSYATNDFLRNEASISTRINAYVAGSFKVAEKALTAYQFALTYRGVALGVDEKPLRYNALSNGSATTADGITIPAGWPVFLEPYVTVAVSDGSALRTNPAWTTALYEVGFLVGPQGIERLVPQQYLGEGAARFPAQLATGDLKWHIPMDEPCNKFGDFGRFIWRIMRAFNPVKPHNIIAVHYLRCNGDTGLGSCTNLVS